MVRCIPSTAKNPYGNFQKKLYLVSQYNFNEMSIIGEQDRIPTKVPGRIGGGGSNTSHLPRRKQTDDLSNIIKLNLF